MRTPDLADILVGRKTEPRSMEYSWRDVALYALAVGAKAEDLHYTFEKNMKTLPTFGVTPYWGTLNIRPFLSRPKPASTLAEPYVNNGIAPLHLEHELIMHRPIDPLQGVFVYEDRITDVFDRGEDKGVVVKTRADMHDLAGNLVCSNIASTLFPGCGGYGGAPLPKNPIRCPEREPDHRLRDALGPTQHLLYRLTGDTNLVHVDPDTATARGYDRVFMQGLCSFGFACRMAVDVLIPGMPERMTRIAGQMRALAYPDTRITLELWIERQGRALFRLLSEQGKAILDKGEFEWTAS